MNSSRPTVLAIDDTPSILDTLCYLLSLLECDIACASDGPSGLRRAASGGIDLALVDVDMPGMSGIEVCGAMRSDPALAATPVVIMTGRATPEVRARAEEAGAFCVLAKPFTLSELEKVLRAAVSGDGCGGKTRAAS